MGEIQPTTIAWTTVVAGDFPEDLPKPVATMGGTMASWSESSRLAVGLQPCWYHAVTNQSGLIKEAGGHQAVTGRYHYAFQTLNKPVSYF